MKRKVHRLFRRLKSYTVKVNTGNLEPVLWALYDDGGIYYEELHTTIFERNVKIVIDTTSREIKRFIKDLHCRLDSIQIMKVEIYKEKDTVDLMLKRRRRARA